MHTLATVKFNQITILIIIWIMKMILSETTGSSFVLLCSIQ
jgi:hypothetical protein